MVLKLNYLAGALIVCFGSQSISAQDLVRDGSCSPEQNFSHRLDCTNVSLSTVRFSGDIYTLNNVKRQTSSFLIGDEGGFFAVGSDLTNFRPNCVATTWPKNLEGGQAVAFDGRDINFHLSDDYAQLLSIMRSGSSGISVLRYVCDVKEAR